MSAASPPLASLEVIESRAQALFEQNYVDHCIRTDRLFAVLLLLQWVVGIIAAVALSPLAWEGDVSGPHRHVFSAVLIGGVIAGLPIALAVLNPGREITRQAIAIGQMLASALLIHLSGGRIETHFHVFGSLAFLAFYRDWKVMVTATAVVAIDHFSRGVFWPYSVFGVLTPSPWRAFEHAGWVIFEDIFLLRSILVSTREMREVSERQAQLQATNDAIVQAVVHVHDAAAAVMASGHALNTTASELSGDASRQSASVTQTSVSVERIAEAINQSAQNAQRTDSIAQECSDKAQQGGQAVQDTIAAMQAIADRIKSVEDIAQNTDLLALNAEVQAARVGEQGRGFAVVALEIRKLAEVARATAQEIGELSNDSVGVAERAGKLLDQIVPSVQRTAELVQWIAESAAEQDRSLNEMKLAMGQLEESSRRNAATSDQLSTTASDMNSQVATLQQSMATLSGADTSQDAAP